MPVLFPDRAEAGRQLARLLSYLAGTDALVLGLPRGGVPVARELAAALGLPLDVLVVRKVGFPHNAEFGMGAVAEGDVIVLDPQLTRHVDDATLRRMVEVQLEEVRDRVRRFRADTPLSSIAGRTVVLVDDGVATGGTARAAVMAARGAGAKRVVFAAPVSSIEAHQVLLREADEVAILHTPAHFSAVGQFYEDFGQVPDDEVVGILRASRQGRGSATTSG